jgi:signal transduction histidine kinase
MMQATDLVLDFVLLFTFISFYGTIAWGLIRYSKRQGYRLWAIGWLVYTIGALQGGFVSSLTRLVPQDLFALTLMFVGATLILDGIRAIELTRKRMQKYVIGVVFFACLLFLGLIFELGFQYIFMPLGFYVVYVCILSAQTIFGFESIGDSSNWWLAVGFLTWAVSWLFVPLTIINLEIFDFFVILQAIGVIITGSSMLTLFTRTVANDLQTQYQISQILSGLVQHDIRNYIHTARHALELTEGNDVVENHWINIAAEVLEDASHFVDEMREISVSLSKVEQPSEKVPVVAVVKKARDRVSKEYKLTDEQIQIQIPNESMIENSRLIDELLWNIFDNAFKHGSSSLSVKGKNSDTQGMELEIRDRGGGLPDNIKEFLNSPDAISRPNKPLVGLGALLIRGIASLVGIQLHVTDNIEDFNVTGTIYHLRFYVAK